MIFDETRHSLLLIQQGISTVCAWIGLAAQRRGEEMPRPDVAAIRPNLCPLKPMGLVRPLPKRREVMQER